MRRVTPNAGSPGGGRRLPTTAAGAEFGLVLAFVTLRAFDVLQLVLATPSSLSRSPAAGLDAALIVAFIGWSSLLCLVLVRRRRFDEPRLVWVDVAMATVILAATHWFTQPGDRFSSWAAWGYAVTLSVAVGAGVGLRRWWQTLTAVAILTGVYLVVTLSGATRGSQVATTLTNSLSYLMFAVVIRFPAGYMRRLAADADAARGEAARLAQNAERERHRLMLHDHAAVLALLAQPELSPELADAARAQAASGATRVRRFLADEPEQSTELGERLSTVVAEFPDLNIELNTDQVTRDIPGDVVGTVADAVRTLLHNVRRHAAATQVVVYAATPPGGWEVQVSDDGHGFDPVRTPEGFGLAQQVRATVRDRGGDVEVVSAPGEGTSVRLSGPTP